MWWISSSTHLQLLDALLQLADGLLQLLHGSSRQQVAAVGLCSRAVPHHHPLQGRLLRGSSQPRGVPAPLRAAAPPASPSSPSPPEPLLALGQLPRQLPDGPPLAGDLLLLLPDGLPELLGGGAEVAPVLPGVQRRVLRLLLEAPRAALPGGDRRADEPADRGVVPRESRPSIQTRAESGRLRAGRFRTVESSERSGARHGAPGGGSARRSVRVQRVVVGRGLAPRRRAAPGGAGVHGRDDADHCPDEGHHARGQDHNDELQGGGGGAHEQEENQSELQKSLQLVRETEEIQEEEMRELGFMTELRLLCSSNAHVLPLSLLILRRSEGARWWETWQHHSPFAHLLVGNLWKQPPPPC